MTVGARIKQRRLELGMTQSELAEKMGYSGKTSVCMAERGGDNITTTKVKKFAEALEMSFHDLMGLDEQLKEFSKELTRQTKPLTDFFETHTMSDDIKALYEKYDAKEMKRAFKFVKAFLEANPERQEIALEILQRGREDS